MQFLIVLAAALACAIAEPQFAYTHMQQGYLGYKGVGYPAGVVPAVGYTGYPGVVSHHSYPGVVSHPGYPAGVSPIAYSGHGVTYPMGYPGAYPVGVVKDTTHEMKSRSRRDVVYPLTTAYTHPIAYTAGTPYTYKAYSPLAYTPAADVPARYNYGFASPTVY